MGIGRLAPETARFVNNTVLTGAGLNPSDPEDSIQLMTAYLGFLLEANDGDWAAAVSCYRAGLQGPREGPWDLTRTPQITEVMELVPDFQVTLASLGHRVGHHDGGGVGVTARRAGIVLCVALLSGACSGDDDTAGAPEPDSPSDEFFAPEDGASAKAGSSPDGDVVLVTIFHEGYTERARRLSRRREGAAARPEDNDAVNMPGTSGTRTRSCSPTTSVTRARVGHPRGGR